MHRRAGGIDSCEFGGVRRELWDTDDLKRCYFQKDRQTLATYNRVHAKGLIYYGHAIVEL